MKKHILFIFLGLFLMASCQLYFPPPMEAPPPVEQYPVERVPVPSVGLDVSYFYESLSPYGIWVNHPIHRYVWVPSRMSLGWRPYTWGQWVWTDYGWTWSSQFVWGWGPFHYGRWGWESDLGWYWVPGTVWGPCWVTWRHSDFYIGWAPLPPGVRFIPGVGIRNINVRIPGRYWVFVDGPNFLHPSLNRYVFPYERNVTIINHTVHQTNIIVRNNKVYNEGIGHERAQRITKKNIMKHELRDAQRADQRNITPGKVEVYKPNIKRNESAKPKNTVRREDARSGITETKTTAGRAIIREAPAKKAESLEATQKREIQLIERSQQKEIQDLERKRQEKIRSVQTQAEKSKAEKEYKEKVSQLMKSHETEKTQIKKRHEKEAEAKKKEKEEKAGTKKKVKKKIKK